MVKNTSSGNKSKAETEIRKLEQLEIESIHKRDTTALLRLWAKKFVVNNPYGVIVTVPEIMEFIRKGEIDYSTVDRLLKELLLLKTSQYLWGKRF